MPDQKSIANEVIGTSIMAALAVGGLAAILIAVLREGVKGGLRDGDEAKESEEPEGEREPKPRPKPRAARGKKRAAEPEPEPDETPAAAAAEDEGAAVEE